MKALIELLASKLGKQAQDGFTPAPTPAPRTTIAAHNEYAPVLPLIEYK